MIYQHQRVLLCGGNGLLKPEIDTLDGAMNSKRDALRHYEADGANEVIFGRAGQ